MSYKIEKNIPISPIIRASERADALRKMSVGDSVLFKSQASAYKFAVDGRDLGYKMLVRRLRTDNQDMRVWRTE